MAARCSWMKSAICRPRPRPDCCGCCRRANTRRVGGRQPIRADVRIIAATHRDLRALIRTGHVPRRSVLPLNVVPIRLPPLRERVEDIPVLARHFLDKARRRVCRSRRWTAAPWEHSAPIAGRAMCASWKTSSAGSRALVPQTPSSAARRSQAEACRYRHRRGRRQAASNDGAEQHGRRRWSAMCAPARRHPESGGGRRAL